MTPDLYSILELERTATAGQIRAAYRRLAKKFHPDLNKSPDAEARFKVMLHAYEVLSNHNRRAEYDRSLDTIQRPTSLGKARSNAPGNNRTPPSVSGSHGWLSLVLGFLALSFIAVFVVGRAYDQHSTPSASPPSWDFGHLVDTTEVKRQLEYERLALLDMSADLDVLQAAIDSDPASGSERILDSLGLARASAFALYNTKQHEYGSRRASYQETARRFGLTGSLGTSARR